MINLTDHGAGLYIVRLSYNGQAEYMERLSGSLGHYLEHASTQDPEDIISVCSQVDHCLDQLKQASKAMRLDNNTSPLFTFY